MHPEALNGLHRFIKGEFFNAHEYFEVAWRETKDESREFYRALLQICGGFFRLTQARSSAAKKFFTRSLHWLEFFPKHYLGLDTGELQHQLNELNEAINKNWTTERILENYFHKIKGIFEESIR